MKGKRYEKHTAMKMRLRLWHFVRVVGKSGDFGADVIARTPILWRKAVIQCKCYNSPVGVSAVQQAIAARSYYRASVAVVATNSRFTSAARKMAARCGVRLWERY